MRRLLLAFVPIGIFVSIACGSEGDSTFIEGPTGDAGDGGSLFDGSTFPTNDGSADGGPVEPATDVEAVVTTDNAFSFGYGSNGSLSTFIRGEASGGGAIFNCPVGFGPTKYIVPAAQAPTGSYLYVIAWADRQTTQGTLAQFKRVGGTPIYSGDGAWEVCATNAEYDPNTPDGGLGPDQAAVDAKIAACNAGAGGDTYSKGWVNKDGALTASALGRLAIGEDNSEGSGSFPIVCQVDETGDAGIDAIAKWMWFDPQDQSSPFVGNADNRTKTFLIFRLPAAALPPAVVK